MLLGIDYGEKRIGLSFGDELGIAVPLEAAVQPKKNDRMRHIEELIKQRRIREIVVGYPLNMDGSVGFKAREVDDFIENLAKRFALPIHKVDERLTSQIAESQMLQVGKKAKSIKDKRKQRATGEIDSRAATIILQDYLDTRFPHEQI